MSWFGRLLYLIERHNNLVRPQLQGRPKVGRPPGPRKTAEDQAAAAEGGGGGEGEAGPSGSGGGSGDGDDSEDEEGMAPTAAMRRGSAAVAAARQRLQADMAARRAALAAADLRSEAGLRFWLERQRRRWRRQELPSEQRAMLQLAGVQLDGYTPVEWQAIAHTAAALLQGSQITLGLGVQQQQQQRRRQRRQPAAAGAAEAAEAAEAAGPSSAEQPAGQQQPQQQPQQQQQPSGSVRLRAARWVQTQQALYAEGKLSPAQLRYMAFLGDWVGGRAGAWRGWGGRTGGWGGLTCLSGCLASLGTVLAASSGCRLRSSSCLPTPLATPDAYCLAPSTAAAAACRHHLGAVRGGHPDDRGQLAGLLPAAGRCAAPAAAAGGALGVAAAPAGAARAGLAAAAAAASA